MAIFKPLAMPDSLLRFELPAALAFVLVLYPLLKGDLRVSRGEGGVLVGLQARDPARDGDACAHANGECQLARGQIADEEREQDGGGDVDIPETDLPAVVETPRDVGVRLHVGLRDIDAPGLRRPRP